MAEVNGINGANGQHLPPRPKGGFTRRIQFPYSNSRIFTHELSMEVNKRKYEARVSITESDVARSLRENFGKEGDVVQVDYQGSKLFFEVTHQTPQEIKLELSSIEHTCRYGLHLRPGEDMETAYKDHFEKHGLKLLIKSGESDWMPISMTSSGLLELGYTKGTTFRMKVEGGSASERQKAMLDLWLMLRADENYTLAPMIKKMASSLSVQKRFFQGDFANIIDPEKSEVMTLTCPLANTDPESVFNYSGRVVYWSFYKSFDRVRAKGIKEVSLSHVEEIFHGMIRIYEEMLNAETVDAKRGDWKKYIGLIENYRKEVFAEIEKLGEAETVSVDMLEAFFSGKSAKLEDRSKENVDAIINYLVKGIVGEQLEDDIPIQDKPVILLTPSLTPRSAKKITANVACVLAPDMATASHPEQLLRDAEIPLLRPQGKIADFIHNLSSVEAQQMGSLLLSVIGANNTLWMNIGLPQNLYQYLIHTNRIAEAERIRDMALNGPRFIREENGGEGDSLGGKGEKVFVRANLGNIGEAKEKFKDTLPDGIGLVRTEWLYWEAGRELSEGELRKKLLDICEVSTVEVEDGGTSIANPLPVVIRLLDVGNRRDDKNLFINNPENLSGADFLLSPYGEKILRTQLRAILLANMKRRGQMKIMIPYVCNVEEFNRIKAVFQEVKMEMLAEQRSVKKSDRERITLESMTMPLGCMIENKESVSQHEALIRDAHFISLGLNDLRKAYGIESILNPEFVKILDKIVSYAKKTSTPVSCCGQIFNASELLLLMAMGIRDISTVFAEIPGFSNIICSLTKEELAEIREKLLGATDAEQIKGILENTRRHLGERVRAHAKLRTTMGFNLQQQADQIRFSEVHAIKTKVMSEIMKIVREEQLGELGSTPKMQRILEVLRREMFSRELEEMPAPADVNKWLEDEMMIVSFLDEWEIRRALGIKCRCTPYIIYQAKHENEETLWARAIPRGGDTGSKSRYNIQYLRKTRVAGQDVHMVMMNYFDKGTMQTESIACPMAPVMGHPGCFTVTIPSGEGREEEVVEVMARKENGQTIIYRKMTAEKLFVAKVLLNKETIPPHSAISKSSQGDLTAVFIPDRVRLSEVVTSNDISTSIRRDLQNVYYKPKEKGEADPFQVNQVMYIKMRDISPRRAYVLAVDNWLENMKGNFEPLLDDATRLAEMVKFFSVEMTEDTVVLSHLAEINALRKKMRILEKQLKSLEDMEAAQPILKKRIADMERREEALKQAVRALRGSVSFT